MSVPKTMKAVVCTGTPNAEIQEVSVPTPKSNEVLVKIIYASANPTDWKHKSWGLAPKGSLLGCDFSGVIVKTSSEYPHLEEGQKVVAFNHGGKFDDRGSFAEYAKVRGDFVYTLPEDAEAKGWGKDGGLEASSSLNIPFTTAAMAIFHSQGNEYPPAKKSGDEWFFVQGGSSAVGLYAIQLAKAIGFKVAVTCSPHSNDLVKSYGADLVTDYHNPSQVVEEVKKASGGISGALEAIGGKENAQMAIDCFGDRSGKVTTLLGVPEDLSGTEKVKVEGILMYTVGGYEFEFIPGKPPIPANKNDEKWMQDFVPRVPKIIDEYSIKPNPPDVRQGLESVLPGLKEMEDGKISGKKLIFKIASV